MLYVFVSIQIKLIFNCFFDGFELTKFQHLEDKNTLQILFEIQNLITLVTQWPNLRTTLLPNSLLRFNIFKNKKNSWLR